jgi:nitrate/nitrite transporter NarK
VLIRDAAVPAAPRTPALAALRALAGSGRASALTQLYFLTFGGFVAMFL